MNSADKKKEAFKQKAKHLYTEYRFLFWVLLGSVIFSAYLTFHNIYTTLASRESTPFSIERIVDTPYAIDVHYGAEDEPLFAQVYGDLGNSDLTDILRGVSGYYGAELTLYHMEEGAVLDEFKPFYADGMLSKAEWDSSDRMLVVNYQTIPQVTPDILAVNDWDIFEGESRLIDDTLELSGYVDAEATDTEAVQQLLALIELMDEMNQYNAEATHTAYQFDFQHGNIRLHLHSDNPRIIGAASLITFQRIDTGQQ